jgi:hypothetical protein
MMGINDWNKHIIDNFKTPVMKFIELFDFRYSTIDRLYTMAKQFYGKTFYDTNVYIGDGSEFAKQNSLRRSLTREFEITSVSDDYRYWVTKIASECTSSKILCIFVDQPNAYKAEISMDLKRRLWMTPPGEQYTLSLYDMNLIANIYNSLLMQFARNNNVESCEIADNVSPSTANFYDDCHFNEGGAKRVSELLSNCVSNILKRRNSDKHLSSYLDER